MATVTFRAPGIRTQDALEATHVNGAITNMTNVVDSGKASLRRLPGDSRDAGHRDAADRRQRESTRRDADI